MKSPVPFFLFLVVLALSVLGAEVRRVALPERLDAGDANIRVLQPIDTADWIWHPTADGDAALVRAFGSIESVGSSWRGPRFLRFRCPFHADGSVLRFSVSADERFVLLLDGAVVARGPDRGTVEHWFYATYETTPAAGEHLLEAVVWRLGPYAPNAQLSWRGGFILKAEGSYDRLLTTGTAPWRVAELKGTSPLKKIAGVGGTFTVLGTSFLDERPVDSAYVAPLVVRGPIHNRGGGISAPGWRLFPSVLPEQLERACAPGEVRAVASGAGPYAAADAASPLVAAFGALLRTGHPVTVPPHARVRVLWDLGDYYCAYPSLVAAGGQGAEVDWAWAESLTDGAGHKGDRNAFLGKRLPTDAAGWPSVHVDVFRPDGRAAASFTTPWWRCGRWCELAVRTADKPLVISALGLVETRYPFAIDGGLTGDDPSLGPVQAICVRSLEMCSHEMLFDCPFYEQQMYPGDTRVQLLALAALTRDDRLVRRAIELFDFSRRGNGLVGMNFPTSCTQDSTTYSLVWPLMLRDYLMWHDDAAWLKARLPGLRALLHGVAAYEDPDGLLREIPGWNFIDWVPAWDGDAPGAGRAAGGSSLVNLFSVLALRSAGDVEAAVGDPAMAAYWRARADAVGRKIVADFWDETRGLMADTVKKDRFSEHAQCLALLADVLTPDQANRAFKGLVESPDLARATVYFSHYLFEVYGRRGWTDLVLKRFDLWRDYVKLGLKTPLEDPRENARSDCHAWGAHPLYHLQAAVAGVTPAAPFFRAVRVAPCPGGLRKIVSKTPHPRGLVELDLSFAGDKVQGSVTLPPGVPGTFVWRGHETPLNPGRNAVDF